jgi:hypothetical protein
MNKKRRQSGSSVFTFVDTCIFVRVATQGVPGCEQEAFERLRGLIEEGVLILLVPEVVILEIERHKRTLRMELEQKLGELRSKIDDIPVWNEITSVKQSLVEHANEQLTAKLTEADATLDNILAFLHSSSVTHIALTPDILCSAERRRIGGRMKRITTRNTQDIAIIESLVHVFRPRNLSKSRLLFCSENHSDFADEVTESGKERRFRLNPLVAEGFPPTQYYVDLQGLLDFDKGYEAFLTPGDDSSTLGESAEEDIDEWVAPSDEDIRKGAEDLFLSRVAPNEPEFAKNHRERLVTDIRGLLRCCRDTAIWDERSEYKLPHWLEFVPEPAVPYTSLSLLAQIKRNLVRYFEIHQNRTDKR